MLILSTTVFEWFYGRVLGLDRQSYLRGYRNEWSWQYARVLRAAGMQPIIAVRSLGSPALFRTDDGILVRFLPVSSAYRWWRRMRVLGRAPLVGRYLTEVLSTLATLRYLQPAFADLVYVQEYWTGQFDLISLSAKIPVVAGDHGGGASGQRKILKRAALRRAVWVTSQTRAEASVVGGPRCSRTPWTPASSAPATVTHLGPTRPPQFSSSRASPTGRSGSPTSCAPSLG